MIKDSSNIWDRLTDQLKVKYPSRDTKQMAKDILIKRGHLNTDGSLTQEGTIRSNLGAEGRAIDRANKSSKGDYYYDQETNKAKKL